MASNKKDPGLQKEWPLCEEDLPTTLKRIERDIIIGALKASQGNKARAARALGISERLMGLRVKKYDINPREFRPDRRIAGEQPT